MLEDDNYEKTGKIEMVFRAVGARDQVAVLIWVVEIGLFEKGDIEGGERRSHVAMLGKGHNGRSVAWIISGTGRSVW